MEKKFKTHADGFGEVTIEKRGKKGIYQVSFYFEGAHKRKSLKFSNKERALKNLNSVLAEYVRAKTSQAVQAGLNNVTSASEPLSLTQGLTCYIDSLHDKNCAPRDIQQATTRISAFIGFAHSMGVNDFDSVVPVHADSFFRSLLNGTGKTTGKKKKHNNTAVGYFRFVKACMEYLESRSLIAANPWSKVRFQRVDHQKTPKPQLKQLNMILENIEPEYFVAAHALAFIGCREEALLRIKQQHVKLKDGYIHIKPPTHRTKTVERSVPIHPRLMDVLREYKRPRSQNYFCDLRWRSANRGSKMTGKNLNNAIQRAAKKAGFPAGRGEDGYVAHSFRGFFKSHCIKQGIPREIVDIWQGHSDSSIGTRYYFDLTIEESIEFMKKVAF